MAMASEYDAFVSKFVLNPSSPSPSLPLAGLTFAVKDILDVEGHVTGFGNPDWARTHAPASSTAPAVLNVLKAGATCVGKTAMDEMAYSLFGENEHYGTPRNPCAPDRVPGGSSSGSAVAVGAKLVDFSLGSDTGGSVRVPASYCGILGFRPSHNAVSTAGVIPMAQSLDTVGWFAREPSMLKQVGRVLLKLPDADPNRPSQIIIPRDCFQLLDIPSERLTQALVRSVEKLFGGSIIKHAVLGDYIRDNVPALSSFLCEINEDQHKIPSLAALSGARRLLQRYEFKKNHEDWVSAVKPNLGPFIAEHVRGSLQMTEVNVDICWSVKKELHSALTSLLGDFGVLAIPTVPGPPPKLQTDASSLDVLGDKAFNLLSIAGMSGFCQVSIPMGLHDDLPISISLLARDGADGFLLDLVETLYESLKEQVAVVEKSV
ncbi:hypothetical protein BT93_B1344 [Corymbia citriodora subsp. variegata]|nr:hypothetical protein BT93_B1344 [Corymbia citriodora subsp. variegata]